MNVVFLFALALFAIALFALVSICLAFPYLLLLLWLLPYLLLAVFALPWLFISALAIHFCLGYLFLLAIHFSWLLAIHIIALALASHFSLLLPWLSISGNYWCMISDLVYGNGPICPCQFVRAHCK